MKNNFHILSWCFALSLIGCSKSNDKGNSPIIPKDTTSHVSKITINDAAALLLPSLTKQLSVTIAPASAVNKKIVWRSTNNAIVSVDSTGLITGLSEGTATVVARSVDSIAISDTIKIYVRKNYDVYVVGQADTRNWSSEAVYWKNGRLSELKGGYTVGFTATAITVSNNDVYISGTTTNQWGWKVATYWKNGQPVQLSNPANGYENYATAIAVNGDSVYVTGWDFQQVGCPNNCGGYIAHAHCWKSSGSAITDIPLFDSNVVETFANGIALSNGNVYIAGTQHNDNYYSVSKYWINNFNQSFAFTSGSYAQANAIAVSGNDIYVLGGVGCGKYGCINTPKLWKNNSPIGVSLTEGTRDAVAYSLALSGNVAFAAGAELNASGKRVAKCWIVNGNTVTSLSLSDGTTDATAKAVSVVGDDIFFAGYETDNSTGNNVAKYWRVYNKAVLPVTLISTYPQKSGADGIFVQ